MSAVTAKPATHGGKRAGAGSDLVVVGWGGKKEAK